MKCAEDSGGFPPPRPWQRPGGFFWRFLELLCLIPLVLTAGATLTYMTIRWLAAPGGSPPEYLVFAGFMAGAVFVLLLQLAWSLLDLLRDTLALGYARRRAAALGLADSEAGE